LSERRANAVKDYLNSKGVRASRLTARGYGESRPVASNDTDEGRAENRRVELIVLDR
jgi:OOP family OmpA-OmpF porin